MAQDFQLMGQGFDTIELTLLVRVPEVLAEGLKEAQRLAKERRHPEPVSLGRGVLAAEVLSHGGGGGDVILSTGELGEMYFMKTDQKRDKWGVIIKIRALSLLCYGVPGALARMWEHVQMMGLNPAGYSLGRVDYRFDILTGPEFALREDCLLCHNRALVRPFDNVVRQHPLWTWSDDAGVCRMLRGHRIATLMVGKIKSSIQVVIYDKRAELTASRNFTLLNSYRLSVGDKRWQLYRIEVRYAGDALKRRWKVRSFPALQRNLQAMLYKALRNVRYVSSPLRGADSEPPLHPLWEAAVQGIPQASCDQPSQFAPERAQWIIDEERKRSLDANTAGCALSRAAMQTSDPMEVARIAPALAAEAVRRALVVDPAKASQAVNRAWRHRREEAMADP